MTIILDASVTIAWLFAEEQTQEVVDVLDRVVIEGAIVPNLWRLEVANVLRTAVRRGRCDQGYADRSIDRLTRLPIVADPHTDRHAWGMIRTLSRDANLTMYDAAYLELALRLSQPLATRDRSLAAASVSRGVVTLGQ